MVKAARNSFWDDNIRNVYNVMQRCLLNTILLYISNTNMSKVSTSVENPMLQVMSRSHLCKINTDKTINTTTEVGLDS